VLLCPACDPVAYDFTYSLDAGGPDVDGGVCADLIADHVFCGAADLLADGGCLGTAEPEPVELGEALGCTPAGQALGAMSFEVVGASQVDIYAWVPASEPGPGPFDDGAYLHLFGDLCGVIPMQGSGACVYRPWAARQMLSTSDPAFLHVQTAGEAVAVDYQVRDSVGWEHALPQAGEDLSCAYSGPLGIDLEFEWYYGETRTLYLAGAAPAWDGLSWICPTSSGGWRQAAYRLYAGVDLNEQVGITRVHLRDPVSGEAIDHHLAIFQCAIDGEVDPSYPGPLAWDCNDEGDHPSKEIDAMIAPWGGYDDYTTNYVLVLQVPPTVPLEVEIEFEAEVLSEAEVL
jgi:hypothetical protein